MQRRMERKVVAGTGSVAATSLEDDEEKAGYENTAPESQAANKSKVKGTDVVRAASLELDDDIR